MPARSFPPPAGALHSVVRSMAIAGDVAPNIFRAHVPAVVIGLCRHGQAHYTRWCVPWHAGDVAPNTFRAHVPAVVIGLCRHGQVHYTRWYVLWHLPVMWRLTHSGRMYRPWLQAFAGRGWRLPGTRQRLYLQAAHALRQRWPDAFAGYGAA
jgi:hypothetical protein